MLFTVEAPEHVKSIVIKAIQSDFKSALRRAGIPFDHTVRKKDVLPLEDDCYIRVRKTVEDGMVNMYTFRATCKVGPETMRFEGIVLNDDDLFVSKITRVSLVNQKD
jgi:hypothetical protein